MNIHDLTSNEKLKAVALQIRKDDRDTLAKALQVSLELPLPEDRETQEKIVSTRSKLLDTIMSLNDQIDAAEYQWIPPASENLSLIIAQELPLPDWLIENWLPRNELTVFSGMGGTGKSHIMLNLAIAAACGCPEPTAT